MPDGVDAEHGELYADSRARGSPGRVGFMWGDAKSGDEKW